MIVPSWGSSPLTRGKHPETDGVIPIEGLIPAHAGKTGVSFIELQGAWAHPRSRGENAGLSEAFRRGRGSSPLTRGKPQEQRAPPEQVGLIPAHAGKTPVFEG